MTVRLRRPALAEMATRQAWLADPVMMAFNRGWPIDAPAYDPATGCFAFVEDQWGPWYHRWVERTDGAYWFVDDDGDTVGHAHYRLAGEHDETGVAHIGVNVVPMRRGQGLGRAALGALVEAMREDDRVRLAVNEFEEARASAVRIHEAVGFVRAGAVGTAPDGSPVIRWELPLR